MTPEKASALRAHAGREPRTWAARVAPQRDAHRRQVLARIHAARQAATTLPLVKDDALRHHDAPPDTGCAAAPSCFTCPFPDCIDGAQRTIRDVRDANIRTARALGARTTDIAVTFQITTRSATRLAGDHRAAAAATRLEAATARAAEKEANRAGRIHAAALRARELAATLAARHADATARRRAATQLQARHNAERRAERQAAAELRAHHEAQRRDERRAEHRAAAERRAQQTTTAHAERLEQTRRERLAAAELRAQTRRAAAAARRREIDAERRARTNLRARNVAAAYTLGARPRDIAAAFHVTRLTVHRDIHRAAGTYTSPNRRRDAPAALDAPRAVA